MKQCTVIAFFNQHFTQHLLVWEMAKLVGKVKISPEIEEIGMREVTSINTEV